MKKSFCQQIDEINLSVIVSIGHLKRDTLINAIPIACISLCVAVSPFLFIALRCVGSVCKLFVRICIHFWPFASSILYTCFSLKKGQSVTTKPLFLVSQVLFLFCKLVFHKHFQTKFCTTKKP